jgi:vanillate O-demethylase ferredoxin subunit
MNTETIDVVVRQAALQGQNVAVFSLEDASGRPLPAFSAGAHVDLHLPGGLVRPYSLCGDPADTRAYRLGVLKDPASRGGSVAVHQHLLSEGTRLAISAPRNHFPLVEDAPYTVLVGGGIGITPMIAMAWRLHALNAPFEMHYCVRSAQQAAFLAELQNVPWAHKVHAHFDEVGDAARLQPAAVLRAAPAGRHVYVCGPSGFMEWVMDEARAAGLQPGEIHREYFSAPAQAAGENTAFEVIAKRSGKTIQVGADQGLLQALRGAGLKVSVSCEEGVCGTCACTVIEGEPDHRDAYLTDEEREANDQILVCCSRAKSARLVLDL